MNKSILGVVAITAVLTGCNDNATATPLVDPDHAYEIDTWGKNSDIYEFTPKTDPSKWCIMIKLDSGSAMGFQCFDKPTN